MRAAEPSCGPETDNDTIAPAVNHSEAEQFIVECWADTGLGDPAQRVRDVRAEISRTGTYFHLPAELRWAARQAWARNDRCIAKFRHASLIVRDARDVTTADGVAAELVEHARLSTNGGRIRPMMTVFPATRPGERGIRIWNEQIWGYAHDPRYNRFTEAACSLGWHMPPERWALLPHIVRVGDEAPKLFDPPRDAFLEVHLAHPHHPWFADLALRWYALPAITGQRLEAGGLRYPCGFAGWYSQIEITVDLTSPTRFAMAPPIADRLGLDRSRDWTDWEGAAATVVNQAVMHSYQAAGVTIAYHRTEAALLRRYLDRERAHGRGTRENIDWTWVNLPSATPTDLYDDSYLHQPELRPALVWNPPPPELGPR